jgi:acyl carrier protein
LSLHGRAKEIFVVSGKKISLASIDAEIEGVLGDQERVFSYAVHWPGDVSERLAVVFVPADPNPSRSAEIADLILRTVARRFGVRPSPVIAATLDDVPLSGGGKIRRSELARRVQSSELLPWRDASPRSNFVEPRQTEAIEPRLAQIWRDALNITGDLDRNASFFDLGGDSLRSVMLHEAVEQQFGKQISPEDFFAEPTFSTLLKLVASGGELTASGTAEATVPWPLPADLRGKLLRAFAVWDGNRPTRDKLVASLNVDGGKIPLFWVFQEAVEFRKVASALGQDQPLYAFRSGLGLLSYSENEIQAFALRYVSEIEEVCPEGPVFVGGTCQGAVIALAMAQHLLRRKRHVPLLILMEWGFPLQPYSEPVLLIQLRWEPVLAIPDAREWA